MNIVGIVAEYNPFHNGHKYQIDKIKELYPNSLIVVCMSSSFTQRGNISILNKFDKTEIAIKYGADLVVELPYVYSTSSADIFASKAIQLLNNCNIDILSFGSESADIDLLKEIACVQINNKSFDEKVKNNMNVGLNYPTAVNKAIKHFTKKEINNPNDLLAISYLKEIIKNNLNIEILPIKRTNNFHDILSNDNIISASNIRNKIKNDIDFKYSVPALVYKKLQNIKINEKKLFELLKYKIISTEDLTIYQDVDEGIENRIKKVINISNNLEELIFNIKSKRYTYNKINRILCHILCSFTKEENEKCKTINYMRILGFNKKGREYLNNIKKDLDLPILNSMKNDFKALEIEKRISDIYNLLNDSDINFEKSSKPYIDN